MMIGTWEVVLDLPADLIAIHARQHQVEKDQVRLKDRNLLQADSPSPDDLCIITFFFIR